MDAYIYESDLYCCDCATSIQELLGDQCCRSDDSYYPQGPYANGGGEADRPQHCASCGVFLENPLTDDGRAWVADNLKSAHALSEHYGIE